MPMLEDDFIISIYENQILRLRSLTEDYEWMTFFEKDFSILEITSHFKNPTSSLSMKSQEPLQLVKNKTKASATETSVPQAKTKESVKSGS